MRAWTALAVLALLGATASGCGGDDPPAGGTPAPVTGTAPAAAPSGAAVAPKRYSLLDPVCDQLDLTGARRLVAETAVNRREKSGTPGAEETMECDIAGTGVSGGTDVTRLRILVVVHVFATADEARRSYEAVRDTTGSGCDGSTRQEVPGYGTRAHTDLCHRPPRNSSADFYLLDDNLHLEVESSVTASTAPVPATLVTVCQELARSVLLVSRTG